MSSQPIALRKSAQTSTRNTPLLSLNKQLLNAAHEVKLRKKVKQVSKKRSRSTEPAKPVVLTAIPEHEPEDYTHANGDNELDATDERIIENESSNSSESDSDRTEESNRSPSPKDLPRTPARTPRTLNDFSPDTVTRARKHVERTIAATSPSDGRRGGASPLLPPAKRSRAWVRTPPANHDSFPPDMFPMQNSRARNEPGSPREVVFTEKQLADMLETFRADILSKERLQ
ncbi:hypothetical protein H0H87_004550, partial [Tephrocybe sp. NHM501043]